MRKFFIAIMIFSLMISPLIFGTESSKKNVY